MNTSIKYPFEVLFKGRPESYELDFQMGEYGFSFYAYLTPDEVIKEIEYHLSRYTDEGWENYDEIQKGDNKDHVKTLIKERGQLKRVLTYVKKKHKEIYGKNYVFFKENKVDQRFEISPSDLMRKFSYFLQDVDLDEVKYYGCMNLTLKFLCYKEGLNSSPDGDDKVSGISEFLMPMYLERLESKTDIGLRSYKTYDERDQAEGKKHE